MNTEGLIEITGADLRKIIHFVYDKSAPIGLGVLHYTPEPLSEEEVNELIEREKKSPGHVAVHMDYVNGRQCKFVAFRDDEDRLWIRERWFDHEHMSDELIEFCKSTIS